ncbi:uncharacterized protein JCM15063_000411 [Sporobolomyces koalae]|uniref:uncharacterized protein n=1 Tax=Sporobolomyces koalae TaxID=500713 RepID=UPI0031731123
MLSIRMWLAVLWLITFNSSLVFANTEIINFNLKERLPELPKSVQAYPNKAVLLLNEPQHLSIPIERTAEPSHVLIEYVKGFESDSIRAKFEKWQSRFLKVEPKRTIRLSWSASFPTDFNLKVFEIPSDKYRSTWQPGGFLLVSSSSTATSPDSSSSLTTGSVPVTVVIEPVWIGVIPESTIGALLTVLGVVFVLVVGRVPQRVVEQVRTVGKASGRDDKDKTD